jgi:hypothetical protein
MRNVKNRIRKNKKEWNKTKFEIQKQGLETKERLEIKTKGKIRN